MRFYKRAAIAAMSGLSGSLTNPSTVAALFGVEEFESHLSSTFNGVWRASGKTYLAGETRSFGFGGVEGFFFTNSDSGVVNATTLGGSDIDAITDITVDASGNIIVCGYSKSLAVNAVVTYDGFIAKFDADHNLLWQKYTKYSTGSDYIYAVKCSADGTIVAVGHTGSYNSGEMFIAKFGADGSTVWHYNFGHSAGFEAGYDVTTDSSNNIYVVGETTSTGVTYGDYDVFVAKFSSVGAITWQRDIGGTGTEHANGLAVDAFGNVFIGVTSTSYNASYMNVVLVKLTPSGFLQNRFGVYCTSIGGQMMSAVSIHVVSNGPSYDVYMVCTENGYSANDGYRRACLLFKFNSTANILWSRRLDHAVPESGGLTIQSAVNDGTTLYLSGNVATVNRLNPDSPNTTPILITLPLNNAELGTQGSITYSEATTYAVYSTTSPISGKPVAMTRTAGVSTIGDAIMSDLPVPVSDITTVGKAVRLMNDRYGLANSELEATCLVEHGGKVFASGNAQSSTTCIVLDPDALSVDAFIAIYHGAQLPTYGIAASSNGVATACVYSSGRQAEIRRLDPATGSIPHTWLMKRSAGSETPIPVGMVPSAAGLVVAFVCQDIDNSNYHSSYLLLLSESDFSILGSLRLRANSTHSFYTCDCKPNLPFANSYVLSGYSSQLNKGFITLASGAQDGTLASSQTVMAKDPVYSTAFAKCCIDETSGTIVVSGYVTSASSNKDVIVAAFTSDLQPLWARSYSSRSHETGSAVAVANGIVYSASLNTLACYDLVTGTLLGMYGVCQCSDLLVYGGALYTYEYQAICKYDLVNGLPLRQDVSGAYTTRSIELVVESYAPVQTSAPGQVIDMAMTSGTESTTSDMSNNYMSHFDITNGFARVVR